MGTLYGFSGAIANFIVWMNVNLSLIESLVTITINFRYLQTNQSYLYKPKTEIAFFTESHKTPLLTVK
jgi:hypothetical protein